MKVNSETVLSFGVFGLGLVAIGYAIGLHSKMKSIADKLDTSIDKIANEAEIDIPAKVIDSAVQKAIERETYTAVKRATDTAIDSIDRKSVV